MKTHAKEFLFVSVLIAGIGLMLVGSATAQTLTTLHNFVGYPTDGGGPEAGLILSSNTLYGTASVGGISNGGTMFLIKTDGTGYYTRHGFTGASSDGANPQACLVLSGNTLFGTTAFGGSLNGGAVFAINTDGTGYSTLHSFIGNFFNTDGAGPRAGLILSGNTLYGTARTSGAYGGGTVFAINTDGLGYTNLYNFTATSGPLNTNGDGSFLVSGLILSGDTLYGTAQLGGTNGYGTVFKLNTNGTAFTTLHNFTGAPSDGANPLASLILSGNTLFGTASQGGTSNFGTVFAINTDGTGYTNLHNFIGAPSDGQGPHAGLILRSNTLFGTTANGGDDIARAGTVFSINTDGTGYTTLYKFTGGNNGAGPDAGLILSSNTLYGTTSQGTVFSLSFLPQLTINLTGTNVVLAWRTNVAGFDYTGFTLQSTTNLNPAVWNTVSPASAVVNGQFTVTNSISSTQMFYRLSQ